MVANFTGSSNISALIAAINNFPQEWALTPCVGKKNLWPNWNNAKLDRARLIEAIRSQTNHEGKPCKWTGVSLVSGPLSGGIMAIDYDGPLALQKYLDLSAGELPPTTMRWTSGKLGHFQILLSVPPDKWKGIGATKFFILHSKHRVKLGLSKGEVAIQLETTEENISLWESGSKSPVPPQLVKKLAAIYGVPEGELVEKLELRWNECSTLPPSMHPGTGEPYFWENQGAIAEYPDFILDLMSEASAIELPQKPKPENLISTNVDEKSLVDILEAEILPRLDAEEFYGSYTKLKTSGKNLKGLCPLHQEKTPSFTVSPDTKLFKCFGCDAGGGPVQFLHQIGGGSGSPSGKEFVEIVRQLGDRVGVKMPDRKLKQNPESSIQKPKPNNVITHPRFAPPDPAELREQITTLINAGTTGSKLTSEILSLAKGTNPQLIWRIYHEILEETERADERLDRKADVENLISISKRRLTLENYLHPSLAEPIKQLAVRMGVDSEAILTYLLPIVAGLMNPNSSIVAKECINFEEPFILYMILAALTGDRKSPPLKVVKAPLVRLQSAEDKRHSQELQAYESNVQTPKGAKSNENNELPQKPNPPREYFVDNVTVEALDKIKGQQPEHGLTLIKDELSGLFASHGAYKGGKGADKESYLTGWNGGGVKKNRAGDGSRVSLARDSLSITGAIQPDKLRALLGDFSDAQGEWARFLFYHMPSRPYKIPRDDRRFEMTDLLEGIYKRVDALPILRLRFDKPGQTYFDDWYDKKDEQKLAESRPGLRAAIAKMPGQAVRLIGVLHVLWEVASGAAEVPEIIPLARIQAGCKLADFYLGQVTLLQVDGDVATGELSPILKKLLEKVAEFKSLTARQAIQTIRDLKQIKAPKVRELFTELKAMGLADTQGTGTRMILVQKVLTESKDCQKDQMPCPVDASGDNTLEVLASVDKMLTSNLQPQTYTDAVFQDVKQQSVGTVDAIETFDLSPPSPELVEPIGLGEDKQASEISNEVANTPTLSPQSYIEQAIEGVGKTSTVDVNTFEIANTSPIAQPEPETTPTAQAAPTASPEPIAPLIERVKAAQTWAEVEAVWGADLQLKAQIKAQLSKDELKRIGKLYKQAHPSPPPIVEAEPIALPDNSPAQESAETAPETAPTPEPVPEPEQTPEQTPEPAQIAPEDAEKMRDIALVWWPEMYPEALQSLVTQMFGWGAPAKKYSASLIAQWLQGEDDLVKYRIGELMANGLADNYENDDEEDRGI